MERWSKIPLGADLRDAGDDVLFQHNGAWYSVWAFARISHAEILWMSRILGHAGIVPSQWIFDDGNTQPGASAFAAAFPGEQLQHRHKGRAGGRPQARAESAPPATPPREAVEEPLPKERTWIHFCVIDDGSGEPISGVTLRLRLPDGSEVRRTTDASGRVEIHDTTRGSCTILEMMDEEALEVLKIQPGS